jgi:hydrogenase maturation protease
MDVAVLGLGNVLMGDDAAGPHVLRLLSSRLELLPGVELLDLGTPGPELAHIVEGKDALIVVDTVRYQDGAPGDLRLLRRDEILRGNAPQRLSPHDPSLRGALLAADFIGRAPRDVLLVGIVPGRTELGLGLSAPVAAALDPAVVAVEAELERLGVLARRRPVPLRDAVWWQPVC